MLVIISLQDNAQNNFPPNNYRSLSNMFYWKNRKPTEAYWQQDIYCKIEASLNDTTDIVDGTEELTYWNNSLDTLTYVYFHLYQNAFQPNSYWDNLKKNQHDKQEYGHYQKQGLGTKVSSITSDGVELKTQLDNTILKVFLAKPLVPGGSTSFKVSFKTYFDKLTDATRMKLFYSDGFKHYDLVHWYPRIAVYDRKFGWDSNQHLGHEFYGDFGTFDAEITFPNDYIVEATGSLLNKDEVLPDELRKKLDISNFKNKPFDEAPSIIIPRDNTTKTWKYHAENVHDFALTADPTYRIGEAEWNGVKCIAMAQEMHASKWQNAAEYTAKIIKTYSTDFGMYLYPKMVVADAQDGMEYPMLTLDGEADPEYRTLLTHEVGHNWFFGMVGSNETYNAPLDEGFTQFIEVWANERIDGMEVVKDTSSWLNRLINPRQLVRNSEIYDDYIQDVITGDKSTLNTHSDYFNDPTKFDGGYSMVYTKTATMLFNLQYVLGDSLFRLAMSHYFNQWKLCHPYLLDFRNSIIQFTHVDLNWFFDEWLETSKYCDYKIKSIKTGDAKDEYIITLKRIGSLQMPIDLEVTSKDGTKHEYYIPNTWYEKQTDATVLPRWIGWDKLKPTYEAKVMIPNGIDEVMIDPSNRLGDINYLNNSNHFHSTFKPDYGIIYPADKNNYEIVWRPDEWYNAVDGLKLGLHFEGGYLHQYNQFHLNAWTSTIIGKTVHDNYRPFSDYRTYSYIFGYKTPLTKIGQRSMLNLDACFNDGLSRYGIGIEEKDISLQNTLTIRFQTMYRDSLIANEYLLYPQEWTYNKFNTTLNIGLDHQYTLNHGSGSIHLNLKSSALWGDDKYSTINLSEINRKEFWNMKLRTRIFIQYGSGNAPLESSLYAAGANEEEMMDNKYTRAIGFVDAKYAGAYSVEPNHFQDGGGLNLRGFAGYLLPVQQKDGTTINAYRGNSGGAINAELDIDQLSPIKLSALKDIFKLDIYLFGDAGTINYNQPNQSLLFSNVRMDAGIGTAFTIKNWGPFTKAKPLTIRFDFPLFLNPAPFYDANNFQYRWIFGIGRSF